MTETRTSNWGVLSISRINTVIQTPGWIKYCQGKLDETFSTSTDAIAWPNEVKKVREALKVSENAAAAAGLERPNTKQNDSVDRLTQLFGGLSFYSESGRTAYHEALLADRMLQHKSFCTTPCARRLYSHGLRQPLSVWRRPVLLASEYQYADRMPVNVSALFSGAYVLRSSACGDDDDEHNQMWTLRLPLKPWLPVLFPYTSRHLERISGSAEAVPHLRRFADKAWKRSAWSIDGHTVTAHDPDAYFDHVFSVAFSYPRDAALVEAALDGATHDVVFRRAGDDGAGGAAGMLWRTVRVGEDDGPAALGRGQPVQVRVGGQTATLTFDVK